MDSPKLRRSCERQGDTRHNSSPSVSTAHLANGNSAHPMGQSTTTRGTATTHAAHSETARPGGADGEAEALTPVVERSGATGVRRGRGLVTGQPAQEETGMGLGRPGEGRGGT